MDKVLFKNNLKSYMLVTGFGIVAGLLVALFSRFPAHGLWNFALFSSGTLGFWMFSTSLIVLFSGKNFVAAINAVLYVYFMFYVTGVFKRLALVRKGYNSMTFFYEGLWQELAYGLVPAVVCAGLAFVLWYGRKKKWYGVALRFLPAAYIVAEAVALWVETLWTYITLREGFLFMAIIDTVCAAAYILIIIKTSNFSKKGGVPGEGVPKRERVPADGARETEEMAETPGGSL